MSIQPVIISNSSLQCYLANNNQIPAALNAAQRFGAKTKPHLSSHRLEYSPSTKRGNPRVFFHLLDTALVNAWILFWTTIQARRRYTLAKFKESVIISLCDTSRKYQASQIGNHLTLPIHSLEMITQNQVQPIIISSQTSPLIKENISIAKLLNVMFVMHANWHAAPRAVGNTYTNCYCILLQEVR